MSNALMVILHLTLEQGTNVYRNKRLELETAFLLIRIIKLNVFCVDLDTITQMEIVLNQTAILFKYK